MAANPNPRRLVWSGTAAVASIALHALIVGTAIALPGCGDAVDSPQHRLSRAAAEGNIQQVRQLLSEKKGIDVNWKGNFGNGNTVLVGAAGSGSAGLVDALLRAGANPNAAGIGGVTPLYLAASEGRVDVMRMLISAGADVNQAASRYGETPLMVVAVRGHYDAARMLLEAGADASARRNDGRTARQMAAQYHNNSVANLLGTTAALPRTPTRLVN